MYKNILKNINFLLYLLVALLIATVQSTIFAYYPLHYFQPDLLLIMVVYLGFKRDILEGGTLVLLAAMILEAHSSAGRNFLLTTYLYTFLIAKILSRMVVVPDMVTAIGFVTGLTIFKRIGLLILLGMQGRAENSLKHFMIFIGGVLLEVVVQATLTPPFFAWFNIIDMRTYKDEHSEDEYDINKEF
jgi:hypothetical protein